MTTRHRRTSGVPNVPGRVGGEDWDDTHIVRVAHLNSRPFGPTPMTFGVFVDVDPFVADGGSFQFVIDGIPTGSIAFDDPISTALTIIAAHPSIGTYNVRIADASSTTLRLNGYLDFGLAGDLLTTDIDIDIISTITPSIQLYTSAANVGSPPNPSFGDYAIDESHGNVWRFDGHDSPEPFAAWDWQPVAGPFVDGGLTFTDGMSAGGRTIAARDAVGGTGEVTIGQSLLHVSLSTFDDGVLALLGMTPTRVDIDSPTLVEMSSKKSDGSHTYTRVTASQGGIDLRANHDTIGSYHGDLGVSVNGIFIDVAGARQAVFQVTPTGILGSARDASGNDRASVALADSSLIMAYLDAAGVRRGGVVLTDGATEVQHGDGTNLRANLLLDDAGNALLDSRDSAGTQVALVQVVNDRVNLVVYDGLGAIKAQIDVTANNGIIISAGLPTSDPAVGGQLWDDAGVVRRSDGVAQPSAFGAWNQLAAGDYSVTQGSGTVVLNTANTRVRWTQVGKTVRVMWVVVFDAGTAGEAGADVHLVLGSSVPAPRPGLVPLASGSAMLLAAGGPDRVAIVAVWMRTPLTLFFLADAGHFGTSETLRPSASLHGEFTYEAA